MINQVACATYSRLRFDTDDNQHICKIYNMILDIMPTKTKQTMTEIACFYKLKKDKCDFMNMVMEKDTNRSHS